MVIVKKCILGLILISITLILVGCENVDLSKVSDKDLERLSEQAIKCEKPYIRFGTSCCLDQNDNKICDKDEKTIEVIETDTKVLDCGEDAYCFQEAVENCEYAKMEDSSGLSLKVTDIKDDSCNVLISSKLDLQTQKEIRNGYIDMSDAEFREVNDYSLREFGFQISKEEIINALSHELQAKLPKDDYLSGKNWYPVGEKSDIFILMYFGVLSPDKFLPAKCTLPAGIACIDHKATATNVVVILQNGMGFDASGVTVKIGGTCSAIAAPTGDNILNNGEKETYTAPCTLTSGSKLTASIGIDYTNADTGLVHVVNGTITTRIS